VDLVFDTTRGLTKYFRPELVQELKYRVSQSRKEARAKAIEEVIEAVRKIESFSVEQTVWRDGVIERLEKSKGGKG